jgi:TPR repeat protein
MRRSFVRYGFFALMLLAAGGALAADFDSQFEYVPWGDFSDSLRKAEFAYQDKRFEEAFGLFQRAACAGDKESQAALSRMYFTGKGVERDDLTGYAWLKVAAEVDYPPYRKLLGDLDRAMTPEQRVLGTRLADQMTTNYGRSATRMSCEVYSPTGSHVAGGVLCAPDHLGRRTAVHKCVADASHS